MPSPLERRLEWRFTGWPGLGWRQHQVFVRPSFDEMVERNSRRINILSGRHSLNESAGPTINIMQNILRAGINIRSGRHDLEDPEALARIDASQIAGLVEAMDAGSAATVLPPVVDWGQIQNADALAVARDVGKLVSFPGDWGNIPDPVGQGFPVPKYSSVIGEFQGGFGGLIRDYTTHRIGRTI